MNIGNFVGAALGIKLINGKIKPKYGKKAIAGIVFMLLLLLLCIILFIYELIKMDLIDAILYGFGIVCFLYLFLISPYTQKSSYYYIEFQNENTLDGFKLSYKGKLVNIKYIVDKDGKIAFANNSSKLSCISYADGTKMNNFTKYRIINYFSKWLNDNNLLSSEVTATFEQ